MRTKNVKPYTYGSLYKQDHPDDGILPITAGNLVNFNIAGPYQNTRPNVATNRITVFKSGVYHITANVSVILEEEQFAEFTINLSSNKSEPYPLVGSIFDANGISIITGTTVQSFLNAGDEVGIYIAKAFASGDKPLKYNRAALTLFLLDEFPSSLVV
ncbi:hypothetical protein M670_04662 [Schinkia azotoformans MEV2011]|uniref:C1q domain n=1 Tax=Schinkia azotoformans MEV2011 TaxID=1348973 RepID=A0A072NFZ9_SCHAZ|nr:hypothetical protein [Schinkia azotoformans]KEF36137.1 hypothetical protein M670_04662 [Schinkia azotoformans MEV2011]MEC1696269.1 hypothetical protein [Schinkia azotoformans]MEC1727127.1 hypothetical protein [Schinkia azotoformans]MEC1771779.1 hypothetical protein [Schinkia azotoformans]MED4367236.1 hypothetical protein [Schinkia azotoformans]